MDPRTRDFVLVGGKPYRIRPLDADWILGRFPPRRAAALGPPAPKVGPDGPLIPRPCADPLRMLWRTMWRQYEPGQPLHRAAAEGRRGLRLFPIVGGDACFGRALLSRGRLEEAGRLVPDRAWVASTPLYG